MSDVVELFVGLLLAVAALGLLARKLKIAYPILLVLGGLAIGLIPGLPHVQLNPQFIFLFLLPPLLYPAALFTPWREFRANLRPILLLAVGLVLATTVTVGLLVHYLIGLPLAVGFVLGAIVSPPDAIAAAAIAERLRVPRRIIAIIEGESLVNDATALVAYRFAVAAVMTGSFSLTHATGQFLLVAGGGIAIGIAIGLLATWFHRYVDDAPVEVTVSLLTPFVAYLLSERLEVSGVLAVVAAGLFLGWRTPEITTSNTRLQAGPFWNMIEFLLNGFVFILIGLELPGAVRALAGHFGGRLVWQAAALALVVILIRIVWVFPAAYLPRLLWRKLRQTDPYPSWRHVTVVAWTGMRGVVSLAAALAIPLETGAGDAFPGRDLILFLTFLVILVTLVGQGLSLPPLIRWLEVEDDRVAEREEQEARLQANRAALAKLKEVAENDPSREEALERLEVEYEDRIRQLEAYEGKDANSQRHIFSAEYEYLSREGLKAERETILQLRNGGAINDNAHRNIQRDLDLAEQRLQRRQ